MSLWKPHPDTVRQGRISGSTNWAQKSYTISGSGTHTLQWRYVKSASGSSGYDCGWVDYVQWSGTTQNPLPTEWTTITYAYDSSGRRIEKAYDGTTVMKYLYDGPHIIAEYDGNNNLLHKYIHGPGIDQPICMIDVNNANATYYYHFDGLGSVVVLTNSAGSVVNLYEYSVYGEVSASDPNHPNRFLFTGREFDKETGLYYYRARYYSPYIGRFLQTDPVGDGMNAYAYCANNPIGFVDPSGEYRWENPNTHEIVYEGRVFNLPGYIRVPIGAGINWGWVDIPTTVKHEPLTPWTVQNFLWQYRYGKGEAAFFFGPDDPFIKLFAGSDQISEAINAFHEEVITYILGIQAGLAAGEAKVFNYPETGPRPFNYNFASSARFIWNLVVNQNAAALYVLGHGTMKMSAGGTVRPTGYYVFFTFFVEDRFGDVFSNAHDDHPSSPRNGWWQDFDDCTPFSITMSWWLPFEIVGDIAFP